MGGRRFVVPVVVALGLVLPFVLLEAVNRGVDRNFPVVLFALMWMLAAAFVAILMRPSRPLLRVVLLIPIAAFWVGLVVDQMPCFLGVPNCD